MMLSIIKQLHLLKSNFKFKYINFICILYLDLQMQIKVIFFRTGRTFVNINIVFSYYTIATTALCHTNTIISWYNTITVMLKLFLTEKSSSIIMTKNLMDF